MHTLSFSVLLFLGLFSVLSMRERRFWLSSTPSLPLALSLLGAFAVGTALSIFGAPGLPRLGLQPVIATAFAAGVATLLVNDPIKILLFWKASAKSALGAPAVQPR
jgi:H+-transporting ATPase